MASLDAAAVADLLREFRQRSALRGGNPYRARAYLPTIPERRGTTGREASSPLDHCN
jgi:hypothetical protein